MDQQLVDDINAWCSAYLNYAPNEGGSWGNHGDFVYQVLLAAAAAAAERDQYLGDAVREHIHEVFVRSGMMKDRAERESDRAATIFDVVQMYVQTLGQAERYLDHHRGLARHRACDPRSDRRFVKPPRKFTYREGTEAWLCATDAEITDAGYDMMCPNGGCPWLHRLNGPALRVRMGDALEELWFEYGELHRAGEPAWTWTESDGTRSLEAWYTHGVEDRSKRLDTRMERRRG